MARNRNEFKYDGIPAGLTYAYKLGSDISSVTDVIAAPSVSTQSIVITDLLVTKLTVGMLTFSDGATDIMNLYPAVRSLSVHAFSGPLKLTAGNAFRAQLDGSDVDYSILVTYYIEV
jgi:hypothetical protein